MLFGYTNPDILSRHQKEIKDEYYQVGYSVPWLQNIENFKIVVGAEEGFEWLKYITKKFTDVYNDFKLNNNINDVINEIIEKIMK